MKVVSVEVVPYVLPFREPLRSASGTFETREGFLLCAGDAAGRRGWGDAAPWPGFGTDVKAVRRTLETLTRSDGPLCGSVLRSVGDVRQWMASRPLPPETSHAVELALLDLLAQAEMRSLAELLTSEPRSMVELHALVHDPQSAEEAVRRGARSLKIKIGARQLDEDVELVRSVRAAVGPDVSLRLDAGGAWDADAAVDAAKRLQPLAPEWLEQPVPARDVDGLARVRAEGGVPVAVDEGAQRLEEVERVLAAAAADVLVVKPMFAGGLLAAQALAQRGHAGGLKVVVTHALESAVGRTGALHLAAALEGPLPACGLSNPLSDDVVSRPPVATGGWANVPTAVGLGVDASSWFDEHLPRPVARRAAR